MARRLLCQAIFGTWAALACVVLAGCGSAERRPRNPPPATSGAIEELHIFSVPMALNFDQDPAPDGFAIQVYASSQSVARGLIVSRGKLEVLMFDGAVPAGAIDTTPPLRTWTFDPPGLSPLAQRTQLGVAYRFALRWENQRPTKESVTVVVRHAAKPGRWIYSSPATLAVKSL